MLIEGMAIAGFAVGATSGYIYIRSEYPHAIRAMGRAIETRARLHGAARPRMFDIEVRVGAGAYVCGEETSLLESIEGKRGEVRAKPPLPAHRRPVRPADDHQQRADARRRALHPRRGRPRPMRITAWAARAGRCRSSLPAISGMAACSRPPSGSRSASWSTTSAAARSRAGRSARSRSAGRWAPISRRRCSICRSTMRPSPPPTG